MSKSKNVKEDARVNNSEIENLTWRIADAYIQVKEVKAKGEANSVIQYARHDREDLLRAAPDSINWHELAYAEKASPGASVEIWNRIKQAACDELENGDRAANVVASTLSPWVRAQFLALRDSFIADWRPKNSLEMRLIDQMAQIYTQYEFWMQMAVQRSAVECQLETDHIKRKGKWVALTIDGNAEMEQASAMADRFNRLFLRTVRALRDFRRYSPSVIVQNADQVNVGGQQVNISSRKKSPKKKKRRAVMSISSDDVAAVEEKEIKLLR